MMPSRSERNRKIREVFGVILSDTSLAIPEGDRASIQHYLDHNELDIAFDVLIQSIQEEHIAISSEQKSAIVDLGKLMNRDPGDFSEIAAE